MTYTIGYTFTVMMNSLPHIYILMTILSILLVTGRGFEAASEQFSSLLSFLFLPSAVLSHLQPSFFDDILDQRERAEPQEGIMPPPPRRSLPCSHYDVLPTGVHILQCSKTWGCFPGFEQKTPSASHHASVSTAIADTQTNRTWFRVS